MRRPFWRTAYDDEQIVEIVLCRSVVESRRIEGKAMVHAVDWDDGAETDDA